MPVQEVRLSDYAVPVYLIKTVKLDVDIQDACAVVSSALKVVRNKKSTNKKSSLFLNGEGQTLISVKVNGTSLSKKDYKLTKYDLTILSVPDSALIEIVSSHNPYKNTSLQGFYLSGPMLSTQCESEGFRKITFYPDRPDVMAKFTVTLHADKNKFPVLLANGNLTAKGSEAKNRHFATWNDPFPKPCYLFAMVAGTLDKRSDSFKTKSGRKVLIEIYVAPGKLEETDFALAAIKKSMKWDEERFNLEYDLDRFMMVATPFFNYGAMENKGLNIFNDSCVLGLTETATDSTISFIERVVAHEYFHNWTGDRVTCRDWFQLSLKEGLTVFREQEFCGDVNSVAVERLDNVRGLRRSQFAEDSGAMAHAVRPDRYQSIDNFYTSTVYSKGSEVVRMIQTLVGKPGFDKGIALYFKRHDGQAVTCEDFVNAMSDANKIDLTQFMVWYKQAGTPVLDITSRYDARRMTLELVVKQSCKPTPGQSVKKAYHLPLSVGLLNSRGQDLIGTRVLSLKKSKETFVFSGIKEKPVVSLLRDFSAPVRLNYNYSDEELLFLLAHDTDAFCRWEAGFKLAVKYLLDAPAKAVADRFIESLGQVLRDKSIDAAFKAMVLSLPSEGELGLALQAQGKLIDPDLLYASRKNWVKRIGQALHKDFAQEHSALAKTVRDTATDGRSMGRRSLKNLCLSYLGKSGAPEILNQAYIQSTKSRNMTDRVSALNLLVEVSPELGVKALAQFEKTWSKSPSVMDSWFAIQAGSKRKDVLATVQKLIRHKSFDYTNPNRTMSLIGVFAGNGMGFHAKNGSGYRFVAEQILKIDPLNGMTAASLAKSFARWRDYEPTRQKAMREQLERLAKHKDLSPSVAEVVGKSLKG